MLWRMPANRLKILVACMPKSGSTFLTSAIGRVAKCRTVSLVPAYGRREQELSEAKLRKWRRHPFVAHHHVRYNDHTARMISKYAITPVILERNFFDVLASLRDHVRSEDYKIPSAYVRYEDTQRSDRELEVMLAHAAIPWYISFALSWRESNDVLFLNYNQLMENKAQTLRRIFCAAGSRVEHEQLEQAISDISGNATRLNVGVPGRGRSLSDDAKETVQKLIDIYGKSSFERWQYECD